MKEKEEVVKLKFFKKVWYSITKFEQYPIMAAEGFKRALKYLLMIALIISIFIMIDSLMQLKILIGDLSKYIESNIPEFSYTSGKLSMETQEKIIIENDQYGLADKVVIDTLSESEDQKEQTEKDNLIEGMTIFLYADEMVLKINTENDESLRQVYTYSEFIANYTGENIEQFNKNQFVQYLTSEKMRPFYAGCAISIYAEAVIDTVIVALLYAIEIAILGWITATMAKIKMRFLAIYNMAIYSLTFPMLLNILYIVINYFINFQINNLEIAYIAIAYIYLAAAIFILKDDFIKRMQEVEKIRQEQLKVREEIKEQDKKEDEENKDDEKEEKSDNKGDEPQGSEV